MRQRRLVVQTGCRFSRKPTPSDRIREPRSRACPRKMPRPRPRLHKSASVARSYRFKLKSPRASATCADPLVETALSGWSPPGAGQRALSLVQAVSRDCRPRDFHRQQWRKDHFRFLRIFCPSTSQSGASVRGCCSKTDCFPRSRSA